eukprot:scaffold23627_cov121-Isochrysis_galbana.AAC.9
MAMSCAPGRTTRDHFWKPASMLFDRHCLRGSRLPLPRSVSGAQLVSILGSDHESGEPILVDLLQVSPRLDQWHSVYRPLQHLTNRE